MNKKVLKFRKRSRLASFMKKKKENLPEFTIVVNEEPTWFDKALKNIEEGKKPFEGE